MSLSKIFHRQIMTYSNEVFPSGDRDNMNGGGPMPPLAQDNHPYAHATGDFHYGQRLQHERSVELRAIIPNEDEEFIETHRAGTLKNELAIMDDGEVYPIVTGIPKEQHSDTAIVFTTAWLTSTRGHNRRTQLRMMQLGYPVILIGPEGEVRSPELSREQRFERAVASNLFNISHDMNRILDKKLAEEGFREEEIITLGESRGAMTGFGFDVPYFSGTRRVAYGDLTAPCFARRPNIRELPGIAAQLVPEILTLGALGVKLFGGRLLHYHETLHEDPEYYAKEVFKIPDLLSGRAGILAAHTRADTPLHVRVYTGDGWSQAEEWPKALSHKEPGNVSFEPAKGYHLDIADPATLANIEARMKALRDSRGFDGSFDKLNFTEIMAAHTYPLAREKRVGRRVLRAA